MTFKRIGPTLAAALMVGLAVPAAASAGHVTKPMSWKATNTYRAYVDLDGRKAPKLKPVAVVNHVKAGQWVRITCQTRGQYAYGSKLWDKVGGLFVPDHYLKTYTDGFIGGAPRCGKSSPAPPSPQPQPSGPTHAQLAHAVHAVAFERVYGSKYGYYKRRYLHTAIDWDKNGCSVPKSVTSTNLHGIPLGRGVAYYSRLFRKSCDRHDFGYRNYGSASHGLALDSSSHRRAMIDRRLHRNMDYQCRHHFDRKFDGIARGACYKASDVFYKMVRRFAAGRFD